ncbi:molecular chaperone Skp [bacterium]|nr:molecular chaperone Skp [bacterium]
MKRLFLLALIVFSTTLVAQTQTAPVKIGYVDSEVILAQFPEAIKAKSDLEGMVSKWRKDLDSMKAEIQKISEDYQKQQKTMKPEDVQKAEAKYTEKVQKAQAYQEQKFNQPNGEYFAKQEQLMKPVKEKIFKAIDEVSKEENMQFVFDKAGEVILLKADPQFDITYKVLDLLKRGKK